MSKKYDFIIFGASGYTGQYVVEEIQRVVNEKPEITYAVAGRSEEKLKDTLEKSSKATGLNFDKVDMIITDVNDEESLSKMASSGNIVINCVGPYRYYGERVVRACVEAGTHHLDISGEPQYLESMQLKYDETAKEKGIHVIGSCGFDSVPADMGLIYLQKQFRGDLCSANMIVGHADDSQGSAPINVTTLECALQGYANRKELSAIRKQIFEPKGPKPSYRAEKKGLVWWSDSAKRWCLPNLAADRSVVLRTQHLNRLQHDMRPTQFNAFYGVDSLWAVFGAVVFAVIFQAMAAFESTRNLMIKYPHIFSFGTFVKGGPKREDLQKLKMLLVFEGLGWEEKFEDLQRQHETPPTVKKTAKLTGPDPGYLGTAAIVVQCAMTLLQEKEYLPQGGGVHTPGSAFVNTSLIKRLEEKEFKFEMMQ